MAREPGVALLMIASGSQIKFEFDTLKAQYFSRKLYLYVEWFRASFMGRTELGRRREEKRLRIGFCFVQSCGRGD